MPCSSLRHRHRRARLQAPEGHRREIVLTPNAPPKAALVRVKSINLGQHRSVKNPLAEDSEIFPTRSKARTAALVFRKYVQSQVIELLKTTNLTELQRSELMHNSKWLIATNGLFASPSPELVRSLSSAARQEIYAVLAVVP